MNKMVLDRLQLPEPILDERPELLDFYWLAWEQAFSHIMEQDGMPQSPYMDEACWPGDIWIWDTCFMSLFCKYAPGMFPGIESLNNFYAPLHDGYSSSMRIHILDNPPLFAWTELDYYKMTNDKEHLKNLLVKHQYLQKHFDWFDHVQPGTVLEHSPTVAPVCLKRVPDGYHWEGGRSGMDNTPRGRRGVHAQCERPNHPEMLWVDAIAQQGLSALYISRLAREIGEYDLAKTYEVEYDKLKTLVNTFYWNEDDGIYYDIHAGSKEHLKCKTPATYWPMLAEMCSEAQAKQLAAHVSNPNIFGGMVPWTTVARDDADFEPNYGDYWRGAVWLPTAYMGIKALEKYGYHEVADASAITLIEHMLKTYLEYSPHTIWECYSPSKYEPAKHGSKCVRPDFCGWSALGPISLFIENYLGFHEIDAQKRLVKWRKIRPGRQGIKRLKFGDVVTDIIAEGNRVSVTTNISYTLIVNGQKINVSPGVSDFELLKKEKYV